MIKSLITTEQTLLQNRPFMDKVCLQKMGFGIVYLFPEQDTEIGNGKHSGASSNNDMKIKLE